MAAAGFLMLCLFVAMGIADNYFWPYRMTPQWFINIAMVCAFGGSSLIAVGVMIWLWRVLP